MSGQSTSGLTAAQSAPQPPFRYDEEKPPAVCIEALRLPPSVETELEKLLRKTNQSPYPPCHVFLYKREYAVINYADNQAKIDFWTYTARLQDVPEVKVEVAHADRFRNCSLSKNHEADSVFVDPVIDFAKFKASDITDLCISPNGTGEAYNSVLNYFANFEPLSGQGIEKEDDPHGIIKVLASLTSLQRLIIRPPLDTLTGDDLVTGKKMCQLVRDKTISRNFKLCYGFLREYYVPNLPTPHFCIIMPSGHALSGTEIVYDWEIWLREGDCGFWDQIELSSLPFIEWFWTWINRSIDQW